MPHAVPVMYYYRGYSLSMETARELTEHCRTACEEKEIDVVAIASDGEFSNLMVRTKDQVPLTMYQLSKDIWRETCKMKKHQLINHFRILNTEHKSSTDENGKLILESADSAAARITTSPLGWSGRSRSSNADKNVQQVHVGSAMSSGESELEKHSQSLESSRLPDVDNETGRQIVSNDINCSKVMTSAVTDETNQDVPNIIGDGESEEIDEKNPYHDETMEYDFDILLESDTDQAQDSAQTVPLEIAAEILQQFCANKPSKWSNKTADDILDTIHGDLRYFTKEELLIVSDYFGYKFNVSRINKLLKSDIVAELATFFGTNLPLNETRQKVYNPKSMKDLAIGSLRQKSYPKQSLNIAYSEYIWPMRKKEWRKGNRVSDTIIVKGQTEELEFQPYYTPEYVDSFRVFVYDKTHLGTNLRKCLCLNKVEGISIVAWKAVAKLRPDILHPTLIEVSPEGKILDQMKETLARTTVSNGVEETMRRCGYEKEAEFCKVVREGLYTADDTPGIHAFDRCKKRLDLINWLDRDVDFGKFPPYGGYIKGMSNILYEGLRTSQESKLYLYALAKSGSYCVRAPNTLCSESFFGSMQDMDPWGQGILSAKGVQKHISDFATITAMKMEEDR